MKKGSLFNSSVYFISWQCIANMQWTRSGRSRIITETWGYWNVQQREVILSKFRKNAAPSTAECSADIFVRRVEDIKIRARIFFFSQQLKCRLDVVLLCIVTKFPCGICKNSRIRLACQHTLFTAVSMYFYSVWDEVDNSSASCSVLNKFKWYSEHRRSRYTCEP